MNFKQKALLLGVVCCLTACGTTTAHEYPSGWPPLAGMSSDCREVQGTYIDPNHFGFIFDKHGVVSETESTGDVPAWYAFGLDPSLVRFNETNVKNRAISISFDDTKTLVLSYFIEGKIVLSKNIPDTQWSCGKVGLNLITMDNPNAGFDKLPGHVASIRTSTLYRVGKRLIVKIADSGHGTLLYALPWHDSSISWFRFEALP